MNGNRIITVFGASGRTGQALITEAETRGIKVRSAHTRNPSDSELRKLIHGADAVVIVFGPRPPYTDIFCARATEDIIRAMKRENVRRLICQTGAMIGNYPQNRSFLFNLMSGNFRRSRPAGQQDRVLQEKAIKESGLNWTIIKPPRLTESKIKKKVHAGENIKVGILSSISRVSLADFICKILISKEFSKRVLFIKN